MLVNGEIVSVPSLVGRVSCRAGAASFLVFSK